MRLYTWQMLYLGFAASLLGCGTGYLAQMALVSVLGPLAVVTLPQPSLWPLLAGMFTGLITLLGFALPPLLQLWNVPTLRVLRKDAGAPPFNAYAAYLLGFSLFALLLLWQAGDLKLGAYVLGGIIATILVLAAASSVLLLGLRAVRGWAPVRWRYLLSSVTRRSASSRVQMIAFGMGMTVLLLLGVVRVDLMAEWQTGLPPDAPNRFVINIQRDQVAAFKEFFRKEGRAAPAMYPMVKARLAAINGKPISPESYENENARRMVQREFNVSWASELPPDNTLAAGEWWQEGDQGGVRFSVEEGIARNLGIEVNDSLRYAVDGQFIEGKVTNLRKLRWDSFQVNFFVIATPGGLNEAAASYITSFYLAEQDYGFLQALVRQFPNVTVIDVAAIMTQVREVIERVTLALEYVFAFTLLAGLTVLFAAIQATMDERLRENAILRTLGANRRQLLWGMAVEFAALGGLAGFLASAAAAATGYVLAKQVFQLGYSFNGWLWLAGISGGALGIGLAGVLATRSILRRPPGETLRELSGA